MTATEKVLDALRGAKWGISRRALVIATYGVWTPSNDRKTRRIVESLRKTRNVTILTDPYRMIEGQCMTSNDRELAAEYLNVQWAAVRSQAKMLRQQAKRLGVALNMELFDEQE